MAENPLQDMVHIFRPALIITARIIAGLLLAAAAGMVAIAVAWGLFVFSSSQSAQTWLVLQIFAAGAGGGLGSILAWFEIDRNTRLSVTLMVAVAVLGGLAGSWLGHGYGALIIYPAIGSSLTANLAMLVFRLARKRLPAARKVAHRGEEMVNDIDSTEYRSVTR